jgi:gamma-glutamylputrescine oxidase
VIPVPDGLPPSLWMGRYGPPEEVDMVVVGGGLVGLSTAYWLTRFHREREPDSRPVVLEASVVAGRASGRNAGFLLTGSAEPYSLLVESQGRERALAFWHASRENRELLRSELLDPGVVECEFQPEGSYLASLAGTPQSDELEESGELLREEGFEVAWKTPGEVRELSGGEGLGGALYQERDGGLDPVRLCRGMVRSGLFDVRTGVRVDRLGVADDGERVLLTTDAGLLRARHVVVAVNAYAPALLPFLARKIRPVRGQALATDPGERSLEGVWYVNHGFEYLRQLADGTVLLGGCRQVYEAMEVGYYETPTATVQGALEEFLKERFPAFRNRPVRARWAGIMGFTADGYPLLGDVPEVPGAVYGAGFSGHGLSLGFAAGRYLARRVLGLEPDGAFAALAEGP